jgi:hypothetical protein
MTIDTNTVPAARCVANLLRLRTVILARARTVLFDAMPGCLRCRCAGLAAPASTTPLGSRCRGTESWGGKDHDVKAKNGPDGFDRGGWSHGE